jgi:hypothetical protein
MAPVSPPVYLQMAALPASTDRLVLAAMMRGNAGSPVAGILPYGSDGGTSLTVTATSPADNKVTVPAAVYVIPDALGGVYLGVNNAPFQLTVPPAHATLDRKDVVVARVYDSENGGGSDEFTIEMVTGTPGVSPTAPAVPSRAYALAELFVNNGGSTVITASNITLRLAPTALRGSVVAAPAARRPASPTFPEMWIDTTTHQAVLGTPGTGWQPISHPGITIGSDGSITTPQHTWNILTGKPTVVSGSIEYRVLDDYVDLRGTFTRISYPSMADLDFADGQFTVVATLPTIARPTVLRHLTCRMLSASYGGGMLEVGTNGDLAVRPANSSPSNTVSFDGIRIPI